MNLLLGVGVDAQAVAANGENALFGPAYRGWNTLVQLMIDKGANVNAVSKAGITPWLAASGKGDRLGGVLFNHDTAALLVKHGADPTLGNRVGADNASDALNHTVVSSCRLLRYGESPARRRDRSRLCAVQRRSRSLRRSGDRLTPAGELVTRYCVFVPQRRAKTATCSSTKRIRRTSSILRNLERSRPVRGRSMPPPGSRRPDNATYEATAAWLATELDRAAAAHPNPGRTGELHRLNRTEYANAVRDLLGVEIDGASMLPPDEQAHGFDTNADALTVVPALLDRYLTAAAKISRLALGDPTLRPTFERYTAVENNPTSALAVQTERGRRFSTRITRGLPRATISRSMRTTCSVRLDKTYRHGARAERPTRSKSASTVSSGSVHDRRHARAPRLSAGVRKHGHPLFTAATFEVRVPVKAGMRLVTVTAVKSDGSRPEDSAPPASDLGHTMRRHPRALVISVLFIVVIRRARAGGFSGRRRIFVCYPDVRAERPAPQDPHRLHGGLSAAADAGDVRT